MPTNRPFLTNFFAAFRAHSALSQASTSASSPSHAAHAAAGSATAQASNPRSIATKAAASGQQPNTTGGATTAAVQATRQASHPHHASHSTSPLSRSPGVATPTGSPGAAYGPRRRRSSSSSTEGFRDALGGEKWWIGGRSAQGEERFYRLGIVRRQRSIDRLSLDRVSL
jgi:hypothetical protein